MHLVHTIIDILITANDDPEKVAEEFVIRHNLKKGFIYVIANHIRSRVEEIRTNHALSSRGTIQIHT